MDDASPICVDANVIVHALATREAVHLAALLGTWRDAGRTFHVPSLWRYEVTNALYRAALTGAITEAYRIATLAAAWTLPIVYHDDLALHDRASEIAAAISAGAAYDAHYLALSEQLNLPFYTTDRRLANAAGAHAPQLRLLPIA
jgi:predicted nucleic acid-binding protein